MNKRSIKISVVLNIIIFILTVLSSVIMFSGFKLMSGYEIVLESSKIGMFKFFTVDSNIFMGIVALIFAIQEIKYLKGKITEISKFYYILKLVSTTSVFLTFFIVFAYLGPISKYDVISFLQNSNLFFHLIIPILSIFTFIFFERVNIIKLKNCFYVLCPTLLYEFCYLINVLIHTKDGKVSPIYDFYYFVQNGVWTALIVAPLILFITYLLGLIIWRLNKKRK